MRKWMAVMLATAALAAVGCGSDDDDGTAAIPEGVPEQDVRIGQEVVAGYDEVAAVVEGDDHGMETLDRFSEVAERRVEAARSFRDQGETQCIADANRAWWLVVGGFNIADTFSENPSSRANVMLTSVRALPLVGRALSGCDPDLQEAIGWVRDEA